jgi:hypothetical protein
MVEHGQKVSLIMTKKEIQAIRSASPNGHLASIHSSQRIMDGLMISFEYIKVLLAQISDEDYHAIKKYKDISFDH